MWREFQTFAARDHPSTPKRSLPARARQPRQQPLVGKILRRARFHIGLAAALREAAAEGAETLNWLGIGSFPISFRTLRSLAREKAWMMIDVAIRGIPRRRQIWITARVYRPGR